MVSLSVVIPLHNDEFEGMLFVRALADAVSKIDGCEIILVDSGSSDGTLSRMHELAAVYPQIKLVYYAQDWGVGRAVKTGVLKSSGEKILILDPESVFSLKTFEEMQVLLDFVNVVFGKRSAPSGRVEKLVVRTFSFFASRFFGKKSDYFCIVHGFRKDVAAMLFNGLLMNCELFPIELRYKIQKNGLSSVELQVAGEHGALNKYSLKEKLKLPARLFLLWIKCLRA